jgi:hypothetical protein
MNQSRKDVLKAKIEDQIGVSWYRTYAAAAEDVISRERLTAEDVSYLRSEAARWDKREVNRNK